MRKLTIIIMFLFTNLLEICLLAQVETIKLWPDGIPGSISGSDYKEVSTVENGIITRWIKVTDPSLTVFLPPKELLRNNLFI